ncbi:MAG: GNAT family N-acetyltransferase [Leptolyngbyaceae cyanobacterium MO_188.B28]|nr:GNAT family N-acetyltransferase [Leptolyngbyaceae cyanobacterium MO_188.B28]
MKLQQFQSATKFYQQVEDYLVGSEAEHNLLLGILHTLRKYPERYETHPYLALVQADDKTLATAIRTPPRNLVLSKTADLPALQLIAQDLDAHQADLPGVIGSVEETQAFAAMWKTLRGNSHRIKMNMRIHQLDAVQPVAKAQGNLRQATTEDRALLLQWVQAFVLEAFGEPQEDTEKVLDLQLQRGLIYLWEDGVPVSMASGRWSTPNGGRIGPVYTPPEYRNRGYATACVAEVSQVLLNQGCRYCFLFTNLANPTSNHIYRTIGYQPVSDWQECTFS